MKYYKFVNKASKLTDSEIGELGFEIDKIYPEDVNVSGENISFWSENESTNGDWEESTFDEYQKQIATEGQIDTKISIPEQTIKPDFNSEDFPMYKCHKEVGALKIKSITNLPAPLGHYCPAKLEFEGDYKPIEVDVHYMVKNKPQVGGYFVVYEDGYISYSPEAVFEKGYTKLSEA